MSKDERDAEQAALAAQWPKEEFGDHWAEKASAALKEIVAARRLVQESDPQSEEAVQAAAAHIKRALIAIYEEAVAAVKVHEDSGEAHIPPNLERYRREVVPMFEEAQRELEALGEDKIRSDARSIIAKFEALLGE